jgi:hypothetical protein
MTATALRPRGEPGSEPALVDPREVPLLAGRRSHQWPNRWSHNWPKGGPMLLAEPPQTVLCHWPATLPGQEQGRLAPFAPCVCPGQPYS